MTTEQKRVRRPSDPIATAMALLTRMSPDALYTLGQKLKDDAPRSAAVLAESLAMGQTP